MPHRHDGGPGCERTPYWSGTSITQCQTSNPLKQHSAKVNLQGKNNSNKSCESFIAIQGKLHIQQINKPLHNPEIIMSTSRLQRSLVTSIGKNCPRDTTLVSLHHDSIVGERELRRSQVSRGLTRHLMGHLRKFMREEKKGRHEKVPPRVYN